MKKFRRLKFGLIPFETKTDDIKTVEQILISYLRTSSYPDVLLSTDPTFEVFKFSKIYIGNNFQDWLVANYGNGSGVRASLCKTILNWVKGDVSSKAVTSEIRRDLNRLDFLKQTEDQLQIPVTISNEIDLDNQVIFDIITDRHYFELLALLGPELTAHFLLSLNGIRFSK